MANKRRNISFLHHLRSLGFETVDAYFGWCRTHGFAAKTRKSRGQASREVAQVDARALRSALGLKRPVEIDWLDGLRLLLDGVPARQETAEMVIGGPLRLEGGELVVFEEQQAWCCLPRAWILGFGRELGPPERRALRALVDVVEVRACSLFVGQATAGRSSHAYATGFFNLAACHRQWLRPLADWRAPALDLRGQFSSLANHLLAEYPVPEFLAVAWLRGDDAAPAWRDLFLHVGRGNNPRTGKTPVPLTRRMAHHFLQAPAHYSLEGAMRRGQIAALGGTPQLADACVATRLGEHFGNDAFWLSVLRWFIARPTFDLDQVGPVVDFIRHVKFDCRWAGGFTPAPQPGLSMADRTPDALLRRMERWHAQLHRKGDARRAPVERWPTCGIHGLRWETTSRRNTTAWTVEELLSAGALEQEGLVMGHCVGSYAGRCAAGDCSIWRVKAAIGYLDTERWTVEVGRDRVIVQVRGKCNEPARAEVLGVLRHWAAREKLSLAAGI